MRSPFPEHLMDLCDRKYVVLCATESMLFYVRPKVCCFMCDLLYVLFYVRPIFPFPFRRLAGMWCVLLLLAGHGGVESELMACEWRVVGVDGDG